MHRHDAAPIIYYPQAMAHRRPDVRSKAIEASNALMEEATTTLRNPCPIAHAKEWARRDGVSIE